MLNKIVSILYVVFEDDIKDDIKYLLDIERNLNS